MTWNCSTPDPLHLLTCIASVVLGSQLLYWLLAWAFSLTCLQVELQQQADLRAAAPDSQEEAEKGWKRLKYKLVGNPRQGLQHLTEQQQHEILEERLKVKYLLHVCSRDHCEKGTPAIILDAAPRHIRHNTPQYLSAARDR